MLRFYQVMLCFMLKKVNNTTMKPIIDSMAARFPRQPIVMRPWRSAAYITHIIRDQVCFRSHIQ